MTLTIVVAGLLCALLAVAAGIFAILLKPSRNLPAQYYTPEEESTTADRLLRHRGG